MHPNDRLLALSAAEIAEAARDISLAMLGRGDNSKVERLAQAAWQTHVATSRVYRALGRDAGVKPIAQLPPVMCGLILEHLKNATIFQRPADFIVGGQDDPYLHRWHLVPRNDHAGNCYLHHFLRSDDDRALHDHPWDSVSFVLSGHYDEVLRDGDAPIRRGVGDVICRTAADLHRIVLPEDQRARGVWTLFVTGPKVRDWGFACEKGWVPWQEFTDPNDKGLIGRGCG